MDVDQELLERACRRHRGFGRRHENEREVLRRRVRRLVVVRF